MESGIHVGSSGLKNPLHAFLWRVLTKDLTATLLHHCSRQGPTAVREFYEVIRNRNP